MTDHIQKAGIAVDPALASFLEDQVLAPLGKDADGFWQGFTKLLERFAPRNRELLATREKMQAKIDSLRKQVDTESLVT